MTELCDGCDCYANNLITVRINCSKGAKDDYETLVWINKSLCPDCFEEFKQQIQSYFKWQGNKQEGM